MSLVSSDRQLNLSPAARDLHSRSIVIDTHADTTQRLVFADFDLGVRHSDGSIDIPRMRDGGLDVVAHQAIIENIVVPHGKAKHAFVERSSFVPESRHCNCRVRSVAFVMIIYAAGDALSCSAGLNAVRSATTSVPVPSFVKISASKLSVDL